MNRVTQLDTEQLLLYDFDAGLHKNNTIKSHTVKNDTEKNDKTISPEYILLWQKSRETSTSQAQQDLQKKGGE